MSQKKIHLSFLNAINSITPKIDTVFEASKTYTPISGKEYQELYIIPSDNSHINLDNPDYWNKGIFQLTLKYPNQQGLALIQDRCDLYVNYFRAGKILDFQGLKVRILETPKVVNLGNESDRVVWAVSINYRAYVDVV